MKLHFGTSCTVACWYEATLRHKLHSGLTKLQAVRMLGGASMKSPLYLSHWAALLFFVQRLSWSSSKLHLINRHGRNVKWFSMYLASGSSLNAWLSRTLPQKSSVWNWFWHGHLLSCGGRFQFDCKHWTTWCQCLRHWLKWLYNMMSMSAAVIEEIEQHDVVVWDIDYKDWRTRCRCLRHWLKALKNTMSMSATLIESAEQHDVDVCDIDGKNWAAWCRCLRHWLQGLNSMMSISATLIERAEQHDVEVCDTDYKDWRTRCRCLRHWLKGLNSMMSISDTLIERTEQHDVDVWDIDLKDWTTSW